MTHLLERFMPTRRYESECPERCFSIDTKCIQRKPDSYDAALTLHLNELRPLWAIAGMRSLVKRKKGHEPNTEESDTQVVSFTLTLWCAGTEDDPDIKNIRIITTIRQAACETDGASALELLILSFVKMLVNRPVKARQHVKRPLDAIDRLEQAKKDVMETCATQADGLTRIEVVDMINEVKGHVEKMKKSD